MSTTESSDADHIRSAALAFLAEAFEALKEERILPTARYHPHIRVGRDYFGDSIRGTAFHALERTLDGAYPARFGDEVELRDREFSSAYIFSLLEAAVARCTRAGVFDAKRREVEESIDELLFVLGNARAPGARTTSFQDSPGSSSDSCFTAVSSPEQPRNASTRSQGRPHSSRRCSRTSPFRRGISHLRSEEHSSWAKANEPRMVVENARSSSWSTAG